MSQENRKVLSVSERKNLQMVTYVNVNHLGQRQSITRFEPLTTGKPVYKRSFPKAPRRPQGVEIVDEVEEAPLLRAIVQHSFLLQALSMARDLIQTHGIQKSYDL